MSEHGKLRSRRVTHLEEALHIGHIPAGRHQRSVSRIDTSAERQGCTSQALADMEEIEQMVCTDILNSSRPGFGTTTMPSRLLWKPSVRPALH